MSPLKHPTLSSVILHFPSPGWCTSDHSAAVSNSECTVWPYVHSAPSLSQQISFGITVLQLCSWRAKKWDSLSIFIYTYLFISISTHTNFYFLDYVQQINNKKSQCLQLGSKGYLDYPCQQLDRFITSYQRWVIKTGRTITGWGEISPRTLFAADAQPVNIILETHVMVVDKDELCCLTQLQLWQTWTSNLHERCLWR